MAYCQQELQAFWAGVPEILFIPYALKDHQAYTEKVRAGLGAFGLQIKGIQETPDPQEAVRLAKGLFIGGGNTFLLTRSLYEQHLMPLIRERVLSGELAYMGSSAGSNVATPSLKTTNDMPIVMPPTFETLGLVPFQINPHYQDPDPGSTHMGETREDRLREFHEWNPTPVLGLREGAWLEVNGQQMLLKGLFGARLFRQGQTPAEFTSGADLSFLLQE